MKSIRYILILSLVTLFAAAGILSSCTEDESQPVITGIRVTTKDSTITAGKFNLVVAIVGNGLEGVTKVLFNDVPAEVNPAFVSSSAIVVTIPDDVPGEITNKVTVFTRGGTQVAFDFETLLPEPVVTAIYNEFAAAGSENKVSGNYFYFIDKVLIGETPVQIVKVTPTEITFKMPSDDVTKLPITVVGTGGTTTSTFKFKDDYNLVNFDIPATGWGSDVCWGDMVRVDPASSQIPVISGRYALINQSNLPATGYSGDWVVSTCYYNFNLPNQSTANKVLKFEINVLEPWKAGYYKIYINDATYNFKPWDSEALKDTGFTTDGWHTVSIPLSNFSGITSLSSIHDFRIDFSTPDSKISRLYIALDNFRIVDK